MARDMAEEVARYSDKWRYMTGEMAIDMAING
jgi:hypothetical protein